MILARHFCRPLCRTRYSVCCQKFTRKSSIPRSISKESTTRSPMFYSTLKINRAEHMRNQQDELDKLSKSDQAKLIAWRDSQLLFTRTGDLHEPLLLSPLLDYLAFLDESIGQIFIGLDPTSEAPIFAGCIKDGAELENLNGAQWKSLRSVGAQINQENAALLATVNGMMEWHVRNRFSGVDGSPLAPSLGGYCRKDESGSSLFPRIDPAVICLVTCGDYCLLGRKPGWRPPSRYSLLSGFLEVGETLEQTVAREVMEESGVQVDPETIVYRGSQPWPFPQSVMIGFTAEIIRIETNLSPEARQAVEVTGVNENELQEYLGVCLPVPVPQPEEMEDVRWFHWKYIQPRLADKSDLPEFAIPGPHAIANRIITSWLTEKSSLNVSTSDLLAAFDDVDIDEGRFKYILARVSVGYQSKIVVRGKKGRSYHNNILEELQADGNAVGVQVQQLGGGRIEHSASSGEISIYGYSSAFGAAVHDIAAVLCKRRFPFYNNIVFSYSGY